MTRFCVGDDKHSEHVCPDGWMTIWARQQSVGRSTCWSISLTWPAGLTEFEPDATERLDPSSCSRLQKFLRLAATSSSAHISSHKWRAF